VIGGGVAGPVAAMALQRAGIVATVVEARPDTDDARGVFLTVQVNGIAALRAVDVDVTGLGFATTSIRLRSGTGRLLGEVSTGEPLADGTVGVTLRRADLHRALRTEAARRGIAVQHGRRLVDAERAGAGVRAVFADGTTAAADLLIGADGLHSRVRRLIDPTAVAPRLLPVLNTGGFAPAQDTGAAPGGYEMVFGRRAFFGWTVAPDGGVWWFANPPWRAGAAALTDVRWREWLRELFAGDRGPAGAIVDSTPGEITGWETHDLPVVRRWHRDRMIVIGDAAHAPSPASGQGASMAVEDAVELARCLRDLPDPAAAFAAYERLRRARVQRIVAAGARTSRQKAPGPVGRVLRDALLPVVLRRARRDAQNWMHHHHIDWDAPVAGAPVGHRPGWLRSGRRSW
jgi:FAD-dependent urate hydroxylase